MAAIRRTGSKARYYSARRTATENGVDYHALDMRLHREIMVQALEVDQQRSKAARDRAGREFGIDGQVGHQICLGKSVFF